jgi:hypothetical protein
MGFLRLAAAHVAGVQAGVADGVLLAQPGEEALEAETVAAVGGGAVPVREKLVDGRRKNTLFKGTHFLTSVYQ